MLAAQSQELILGKMNLVEPRAILLSVELRELVHVVFGREKEKLIHGRNIEKTLARVKDFFVSS